MTDNSKILAIILSCVIGAFLGYIVVFASNYTSEVYIIPFALTISFSLCVIILTQTDLMTRTSDQPENNLK